MKAFQAAIIGASVVAVMLLAPAAPVANARGGGLGGHAIGGSHFPTRLHAARPRGNFNQWPLYGGYYAVPPDVPQTVTYVTPERIVFVPEPPRALSCKHSVEKVTVPAEAGGMREITVTRC
jgi:hypothetical protein